LYHDDQIANIAQSSLPGKHNFITKHVVPLTKIVTNKLAQK